MRRCVYCGKGEGAVTFNGREHVVPRLLGSFANNPTIRGLVCDACNSVVFSELETKFKEDTEEGIYYQMFNFEAGCQVRIRGKNIKTTFSSGMGDKFFDEIFPFFRFQDGAWKIVILSQIKVKRFGERGYIIFLVDELKKQSKGKMKRLSGLLRGVESKDVSIFAGANDDTDHKQLAEAIDLVRELGVDYKEKSRKFALGPSKDDPSKKVFEIAMECTIGNEAGRVIAKIAFNYFVYCALESGNLDVTFHPNFDRIKSYILGIDDLPIKEVIAEVQNEPITYDEARAGKRFVGHLLTFNEEAGLLVARVVFLGKRTYKVILGEIPKELQKTDFGCGHLFDPIQKKILGLTQNPAKWGTGHEPGFGLFCRT